MRSAAEVRWGLQLAWVDERLGGRARGCVDQQAEQFRLRAPVLKVEMVPGVVGRRLLSQQSIDLCTPVRWAWNR